MGSGSTDMLMNRENFGIIPRAIEYIFNTIQVKEEEDPHSTYKVHVQFLEIYGEDIKDLLMFIAGEFKSAVDWEKAANRSKALTAMTEKYIIQSHH